MPSHVALEYAPRTQSIYSDLGSCSSLHLEDAGHHRSASKGQRSRERHRAAGISTAGVVAERIAQTMDPWRGRQLVGEVHDENCWALGGAAGHAGLFGSVVAVGQFAQRMLQALASAPAPDAPRLASNATLREFLTKSRVPGSSRALGWDTMLPTSSCGSEMSSEAFGHTGFTGTSLWIDPVSNVYVVLLTNRVHPTRKNEAIRPIRARLHDSIMESLGNA